MGISKVLVGLWVVVCASPVLAGEGRLENLERRLREAEARIAQQGLEIQELKRLLKISTAEPAGVRTYEVSAEPREQTLSNNAIAYLMHQYSFQAKDITTDGVCVRVKGECIGSLRGCEMLAAQWKAAPELYEELLDYIESRFDCKKSDIQVRDGWLYIKGKCVGALGVIETQMVAG